MKTVGRKTLILFVLLIIPLSLLLQGCTSLVTEGIERNRSIPADKASEELIYAGDITVALRSWNWLFRSNPEERRALLEREAQFKAEELYGKEAVIKVELLSGRWHPASLLMLFGLAGYVEDSLIEASVWLPAPIPEPVPEPAVRYRVIPEAEYTSPTEFTTVVYQDREMLEEELTEAFDQGKFGKNDLEKKFSALPATGRISITYGRNELTNAISRWFTFTLKDGEKQVFKKRGVEDIPYVYGTDNLWWNDLSYPVDDEWGKELQFIIEDGYQKKIYRFRIIKDET